LYRQSDSRHQLEILFVRGATVYRFEIFDFREFYIVVGDSLKKHENFDDELKYDSTEQLLNLVGLH
jgi:hypothetical protein